MSRKIDYYENQIKMARARLAIAIDSKERAERQQLKLKMMEDAAKKHNIYYTGSETSEDEVKPTPPKKKIRLIKKFVTECKLMAVEDFDAPPPPIVIDEGVDFEEIMEQIEPVVPAPNQVHSYALDPFAIENPVIPPFYEGGPSYKRAIDKKTGEHFYENNRHEMLCVGSDGQYYAVKAFQKTARLIPIKQRKHSNNWINWGCRYTVGGSKRGQEVFLYNILW